jgi:hypothetical protein
VDVHEHLKLANEERKPVLSEAIVHPQEKWKRREIPEKSLRRRFWEREANPNFRASLFAGA